MVSRVMIWVTAQVGGWFGRVGRRSRRVTGRFRLETCPWSALAGGIDGVEALSFGLTGLVERVETDVGLGVGVLRVDLTELGLDVGVFAGEDWPDKVKEASGGEGVDVILDLVRWADIVTESFS